MRRFGIKVSDVSAFEIALSDYVSEVYIDNSGVVLTSKVDTELDQVFKFYMLSLFNTGLSFKPIRAQFFLL